MPSPESCSINPKILVADNKSANIGAFFKRTFFKSRLPKKIPSSSVGISSTTRSPPRAPFIKPTVCNTSPPTGDSTTTPIFFLCWTKVPLISAMLFNFPEKTFLSFLGSLK